MRFCSIEPLLRLIAGHCTTECCLLVDSSAFTSGQLSGYFVKPMLIDLQIVRTFNDETSSNEFHHFIFAGLEVSIYVEKIHESAGKFVFDSAYCLP